MNSFLQEDVPLLTVLSHILVAIEHQSLAIKLFEDATTKFPDSIRHHRGLAIACFRAKEWKKFQMASMKLSSLATKTGDNSEAATYLMWTAVAMLLSTPGSTFSDSALPLLFVEGGGSFYLLNRLGEQDGAMMKFTGNLLDRITKSVPVDKLSSEMLSIFCLHSVRQGNPLEMYKKLTSELAYLPPSVQNTIESSDSSITTSPAPVLSLDSELLSETYPFADGKFGRGKVPSPFQLVDQLRFCAYLLTLGAQWNEEVNRQPEAFSPTPSKPEYLPFIPHGDHPLGAWEAARNCFSLLLSKIDSEDWGYYTGIALTNGKAVINYLVSKLIGDKQEITPAIKKYLSPLSVDSPIFHSPDVDSYLGASLKALLEFHTDLGSNVESASISAKELSTRRSSLLALILEQSLRCEILHRLVLGFKNQALPDEVHASVSELLEDGQQLLVSLIAGYLAINGSKSSAFEDIKLFLTPFVGSGSGCVLHKVSPLVPSANGNPLSREGLSSFLFPSQRHVAPISLPFHPSAMENSASDLAPPGPLFCFSFIVPRSISKTLIDYLLSVFMHSNVSSEEENKAWVYIEDAVDYWRKNNSTGAQLTEDTDDPHRVKDVFHTDLTFSVEAQKHFKIIQEKTRFSTTSVQVLRYLDYYTLSGFTFRENSNTETEQRLYPCFNVSLESSVLSKVSEFIEEIMTRWKRSAPLNYLIDSIEPGQVELRPSHLCVGAGDDLCLLASHMLLEISLHSLHFKLPEAQRQEYAKKFLFEAWITANMGLAVAPGNQQLSLLLAKLSAFIGAGDSHEKFRKRLEIKYMLADALGYVAIPYQNRFFSKRNTPRASDDILRFHTISENESADALSSALLFDNYSAIFDILRMQRRCSKSLSRMVSTALHAHEDITKMVNKLQFSTYIKSRDVSDFTNILPKMEELALTRDNEDRTAAISWDPPHLWTLIDLRGIIPCTRGQEGEIARHSDKIMGETKPSGPNDAALPDALQWLSELASVSSALVAPAISLSQLHTALSNSSHPISGCPFVSATNTLLSITSTSHSIPLLLVNNPMNHSSSAMRLVTKASRSFFIQKYASDSLYILKAARAMDCTRESDFLTQNYGNFRSSLQQEHEVPATTYLDIFSPCAGQAEASVCAPSSTLSEMILNVLDKMRSAISYFQKYSNQETYDVNRIVEDLKSLQEKLSEIVQQLLDATTVDFVDHTSQDIPQFSGKVEDFPEVLSHYFNRLRIDGSRALKLEAVSNWAMFISGLVTPLLAYVYAFSLLFTSTSATDKTKKKSGGGKDKARKATTAQEGPHSALLIAMKSLCSQLSSYGHSTSTVMVKLDEIKKAVGPIDAESALLHGFNSSSLLTSSYKYLRQATPKKVLSRFGWSEDQVSQYFSEKVYNSSYSHKLGLHHKKLFISSVEQAISELSSSYNQSFSSIHRELVAKCTQFKSAFP